jgi:hypothetical protein
MNYSVYPPNWYLDYPVRTRLGCTLGESVARFPGHLKKPESVGLGRRQAM